MSVDPAHPEVETLIDDNLLFKLDVPLSLSQCRERRSFKIRTNKVIKPDCL